MTESIVVGTDGSETAARAVRDAATLARALGAELHIVSAMDVRPTALGTLSDDFVMPMGDYGDDLDATLDAAATAVREDDLAVHTHAASGNPADALLEIAAAVGASTIVVGSRGMHGASRLLGSIPNTISHRARCNVLIVSTESR
jgi:nucleotide-binding universal stress UspA family protein